MVYFPEMSINETTSSSLEQKMLSKELLPDIDAHLYTAAGNMVGIIDLRSLSTFSDFAQDVQIRSKLVTWGKTFGADSVMVMLKSQNSRRGNSLPYVIVFEPSGQDKQHPDLPGDISTACGNGFRAVGDFLSNGEDFVEFDTPSGVRSVKISEVDGEKMFSVNMGALSTSSAQLAKYCTLYRDSKDTHSIEQLIDVQIPEDILSGLITQSLNFRIDVNMIGSTYSFGLVGNKDKETGERNGEPHFIIPVNYALLNGSTLDEKLRSLRTIAEQLGPVITKNVELFPNEVNANFVASVDSTSDRVTRGILRPKFLLATHERNLGDDPVHSVTASCGTGSTVVGGLAFHEAPSESQFEVISSGGKLLIEKENHHLVMSGPAKQVF